MRTTYSYNLGPSQRDARAAPLARVQQGGGNVVTQQVLFVGAKDDVSLDLSKCLEVEGIGSSWSEVSVALTQRAKLQGFDEIIVGPSVEGGQRLDLCRDLKSVTPARITVISEFMDEIEEMRLVMVGVCAIAFVPVRYRVLAAQLSNRLTRMRFEISASPLTYENLTVSAVEHIVTIDGAPLDVTKTEFDLLVHLISNPRRVYTHEELSRWLWNDPWVVDHHRLEAHVSRLRKKVALAGGPSIISSIRGVGYRWLTAAGASGRRNFAV